MTGHSQLVRFTVQLAAGEDARFAEDAFADKADQPVMIDAGSWGRQRGRLVSAEVVENGVAVLLVIEAEHGIPAQLLEGLL